MLKKNILKGLFLLIIISYIITFVSCTDDPIKIGFIGSLTSKQSQLSIDARNAIEVGIEKVNSEGGVHGRLLTLVVKDDKGNYETSLEKYQEFKSEEVKFVIGPMTSNLTEAILDAPKSDLLFMSPSISTNRLSGIDDNFLRVSPLVDDQSRTFLNFIETNEYEQLTIIYDLNNREYTEYLAELIKKNGQSFVDTIDLISFDSREDNLEASLVQIDLQMTDAVLMISQATDTAFMAQKIEQTKKIPDLYSVSWSMTQDLVRFGGETIEGMHLIGIYKTEAPSKKHLKFGNAFYEKLSYEPSFISILTYDAFSVLVEGMKSADELSVRSVKESILSIENFYGLEDSIQMDEYGDSKRNYLMYEVIDGNFVPKY